MTGTYRLPDQIAIIVVADAHADVDDNDGSGTLSGDSGFGDTLVEGSIAMVNHFGDAILVIRVTTPSHDIEVTVEINSGDAKMATSSCSPQTLKRVVAKEACWPCHNCYGVRCDHYERRRPPIQPNWVL